MAYLLQQNNGQSIGIDPSLLKGLGNLTGNINNPVANYMLLNNVEQQGAQGMTNGPSPFEQQISTDNPLSNGSQSAMQIAKQSLALDENQRNRALGSALVTFFSNMAKPGFGNGFNGSLAAANQSFGPAFDSYREEEGRQQGLNANLLNHQQQQELAQAQMAQRLGMHQDSLREKQLRREEESARKREELEWKKMYGDQKLRSLREKPMSLKEIEALEARDLQAQALERGEQLLAKLPDKGKAFGKNVEDLTKALPQMHQSRETLNNMEELFKEHPEIGSAFTHLLMPTPEEREKGLGILKIIGRKINKGLGGEKALEALEQLDKYASGINVESILGLSGAKASNLMKNMIAKASVNGVLTAQGFKKIKDFLEGNIIKREAYANYLNDALGRGVKPKAITYDDYLRLGSKNEGSSQNNNNIGAQRELLKEALIAHRKGQQ